MFARLEKFWQQPSGEGMTAVDWFLLIGLILVAIWIWSRILAKLNSVV